MDSNQPVNGLALVLYRLAAAIGNLALRYLSSQSRYVLHLAILVLAGVVALANGATAGSFNWFGQNGLGRSTTSKSATNSASQSKGQGLQPPLSEFLVRIEDDQISDSNIGTSAQISGETAPGDTSSGQSASSLETNESDRPHLSSRSAERPGDDIVKTAAKKEATKAFTYEVAEGDTLLTIAQKFSITPETILWANDVENGGELLRVGQSLTIVPVSGVLHKVEEGDNVLVIAFKHEASPEEIIEANALEEPYLLSVGQRIVVPGGRQVPPPAPVPPVATVPPIEHRVNAGDTLGDIALTHAVAPAVIIRANGLANPDAITLGQILVVPGGKPAETMTSTVSAPTSQPAQPAASSVRSTPSIKDNQPVPSQAQIPQPSGKGQEVVAVASRFAGYTYTWGGHSPTTGFDCSGFTWYIYKQVGLNIPQHDLWGQIRAGRAVKRDELLPGDLVFFQNTYQPGLSHSGIYIGGSQFISAASEGSGVRVDRLDDSYWGPRYFGASRPW